MPFLTKLDSRAAIKGSRDPLGIQPIWTRLGRQVVGNLTTVTRSIPDFTTLLLGYYFVERVADEAGSGSELDTFLKWEQLAAYSRGAVNGDWGFRGTERAKERLDRGGKIILSSRQDHQIMSDQKVYGLWGLYTGPARVSGLLEGSPTRLAPPARDFVERICVPRLEEAAGPDARRLVNLLSRDEISIDFARSEADVVKAIARVLRRQIGTREGEFYRTHILEGGLGDATMGQQKMLAELLGPTNSDDDFVWSSEAVRELSRKAAKRGEIGESLAENLDRIATCESVMGPVAAAFAYLLSLNGVLVTEAARRFETNWKQGLRTVSGTAFRELKTMLSPDDADSGERWIVIADALSAGEFAVFVQKMLEQNRVVMSGRGGAAWIEARDGRLEVRFREELGALPTRRDIPNLWRHSYFLDSLREITDQLGVVRQ